MADKYDRLKKLADLRRDGILTDAEYQQEKKKILDDNDNPRPTPPPLNPDTSHNMGGMDEKTYIMLMHLSQLVAGFLIPLIMWIIKKDHSKKINEAGITILNFAITMVIAFIANAVLSILWFQLRLFTIPFLINVGLVLFYLAMIIMAAINHNDGKPVKYYFSIPFIKPVKTNNII